MSIVYFRHTPDRSKIGGYFDEDDGHIYINGRASKVRQSLIIAHESQHKKCFDTKCKCWNSRNVYWCEYHAFRAELKYVAKKDKVRLWQAYFRSVINDLRKFQSKETAYPQHFQALVKVCRLRLFGLYAQKYGNIFAIATAVKRIKL